MTKRTPAKREPERNDRRESSPKNGLGDPPRSTVGVVAPFDRFVENSRFCDLSDGDQWRWLRLATVNQIRRLWKYRNGIEEGQHPYVTRTVARGYLREEIARLREYRANPHREQGEG